MILILSSILDFSTDRVCLELKDQGHSFVRLNREQFSEYELALEPFPAKLNIRGNGVDVEIDETLQSVYFRQPIFLRNTPGRVLSIHEQLERSQWHAFQRSLSVFRGARWMNHPQNSYLAEVKPYQLALATDLGFLIPRTVVTNSGSAADFSTDTLVVLKPLDTVLLREDDDILFAYTSIMERSKVRDLDFHSAPVLLQEPLVDKVDIRVTVVGSRMWAVKILKNGQGIEGDWRRTPKEVLEYEDFVLPKKFQARIQALMKKLELEFGGIDLVETPNGIYFLEINPTGEWGWLNNPQRPIAWAIASWLGCQE